jgi:hypothetical protein
MTLHYIDDDIALISHYLGVKAINSQSTAEKLRYCMKKYVEKFIPHIKEIFITTDNAPNKVK